MICVSVFVFFLYNCNSVWSNNIITPVKNVPGSIIFSNLSSGSQKSMEIRKYLTSKSQNDVDAGLKTFLEEYNRNLMLPGKDIINSVSNKAKMSKTFFQRQATPSGVPRTPLFIMNSLKKIVRKKIAKKKILAHFNHL